MEDNDYVLAFDHFYTNNHIQILKSLIPFIENDSADIIPVLIKYLELQHTISLIKNNEKIYYSNIKACSNFDSTETKKDGLENIEQIYNAIHRYLAEDEEKAFMNIISTIKTMKNMREMQQMMELMQSLNEDMNVNSIFENIGMMSQFDEMNNNNNENNIFGNININELINLFNNK